MKKTDEIKIELICQNRKAKHDYHILESLEVGIVLAGNEVKSLREHHVTLDAAYAYIADGELWLIDCQIDQYKYAGSQQESKRKHKLLLHKRQIKNFAEKSQQKGNTLVPIKMYFKNGIAKVELAICKGKREHDKRETIKNREAEREMRE